MKAITPSEINGTIVAPPSKSIMIRAVVASLLANGISEIVNPSFCNDALTALSIANFMGASIYKKENSLLIFGANGLRDRPSSPDFINCNESGLCIRMFPSIVAAFGGEYIFDGKNTLKTRFVNMVESLHKFGVTCETKKGFPPILIRGRLRGAQATIDGSLSSQFLTGLLMSLPLVEDDSYIKVQNLLSKPYIALTTDVARLFGVNIIHNKDLTDFKIPGGQYYQNSSIFIEGDWSGASFFLVAGAIAGSVCVTGLNVESYQADRAILDVLEAAGASVRIGENSVTVEKNDMTAFSFDASNCPDLVPPLAILAANCIGTSSIYGIERIKHKESPRAATIASQLNVLGIHVKIFPNRMEILGGKLNSGQVNSSGDHRIAMACAIAALNGNGPVFITNENCVTKSYERFFYDLAFLKGEP